MWDDVWEMKNCDVEIGLQLQLQMLSPLEMGKLKGRRKKKGITRG
jgi:hypothetical protein